MTGRDGLSPRLLGLLHLGLLNELVWDITIGAGETDVDEEEVVTRVETRLFRQLTPKERTVVVEATRRCIQEAEQP